MHQASFWNGVVEPGTQTASPPMLIPAALQRSGRRKGNQGCDKFVEILVVDVEDERLGADFERCLAEHDVGSDRLPLASGFVRGLAQPYAIEVCQIESFIHRRHRAGRVQYALSFPDVSRDMADVVRYSDCLVPDRSVLDCRNLSEAAARVNFSQAGMRAEPELPVIGSHVPSHHLMRRLTRHGCIDLLRPFGQFVRCAGATGQHETQERGECDCLHISSRRN